MPTTPPDLSEDLAAAFARRVAERDVVPPPSQTPAAVAQRLDAWLHTTYQVRNHLAREALTKLLLVLLAQPEASTATLVAATGLGPRMAARHLLRLEGWGLKTHFYRHPGRQHRLSRAGEDALLPVVTGAG